MSKQFIVTRAPLLFWLLTGVIISLILWAGYLAATPWADDWIFIGRSASLADAIGSTLTRLINWSPRPASEPTIFGSLYLARKLGLAPESFIAPLLFASYLQSLSLLLWPALLKRCRQLGYLSLALSIACVFMAVAMTHHLQTREVLFWGAGSAAYLPTLAAWISTLCILYLWVVTRERLCFSVAVLQSFFGGLFWEVGIFGVILMPGTTLLLVYLFDQKSPGASVPRNYFPLLASVLLPFAGLVLVSLPALLKRHQQDAASGNPLLFGKLLLALQWPWVRAANLFAHHVLFVAPIVLLLALLLLSQLRFSNSALPGSRLQRQALLCCGLSALLVAVAIRFCLASAFGMQMVHHQRHEVAPTVLLLLGLSFLLAAALPSNIMAWLAGQSLWIAFASMAVIVAALVSSASVHDILGEAMVTATGRRPLPIVISAAAHDGSYDLACRRNAYALSLPAGEWTAARIQAAIQAEASAQDVYQLKIMHGILSGYGLDRLTTTWQSSAGCS